MRLKNGVLLVLETKGQETAQDRTKRDFLVEWVAAVNEHGGFERWAATYLARRRTWRTSWPHTGK